MQVSIPLELVEKYGGTKEILKNGIDKKYRDLPCDEEESVLCSLSEKVAGVLKSFETVPISMYVDETGIDLFVRKEAYDGAKEILGMTEEVQGSFKMLREKVEVRICWE